VDKTNSGSCPVAENWNTEPSISSKGEFVRTVYFVYSLTIHHVNSTEKNKDNCTKRKCEEYEHCVTGLFCYITIYILIWPVVNKVQ
jgi:hypothetical protein